MERFSVTGMSCAACSARVEKAVSKVPGVTSCSVSLLTNSMGVEGTAAETEIVRAVEAAGYGAKKKGAKDAREAAQDYGPPDEALKDEVAPALKKRLAASAGFLAVLMYVSMGHMIPGRPLPEIFPGNPVAGGLLQLLLATAVMVINQQFFTNGFRSLLRLAPNMDALVALGATASYGYSVYALFAMTGALVKGDAALAASWTHEFYFESAAMILTLITVGKMLEARSKGRTTDALKNLIRLSPKTATVLRDGEEVEVPVGQVKIGDCFLVRPGGRVPVDGVVLEGGGAVDESALTGESVPADKAAGDPVSAATVNQSGFLKCEAVRVGEDTALSQIIRLVSDAAATKAPIAKVADRVSGVFVPVVIAISLVTLFAWLLAGYGAGFALARAVSVLVISCPCALGLATPVAIMVGNGVGARNGILFKTAASLEAAGKTQIVALDKTGTITEGAPSVTGLYPAKGVTEEELLYLAASLEIKSEHPLASAVTRHAKEAGISPGEVSDFAAVAGNGLSGILAGERVSGGNEAFAGRHAALPEEMTRRAAELSDEGKTPLFFEKGGKAAGIIAVADALKEESPQAVAQLKGMGVRVVMLTGDNERVARAVGKAAGVDEVMAGALPDDKERAVRALSEQGPAAMVGDGINDAPALARADVGIAIGAGTDVAIDAADAVLMKSRLSDVPAAIRLSRATLRNIHENLFWAFLYNVIGIPLAAGVFIPLSGIRLNPMFGAAAMSLSSFCVVTNALRLNWIDIRDPGKDKKIKTKTKRKANGKTKNEIKRKANGKTKNEINQKTEETAMTKTMKIEGMMCGHCEARVKKTLEAIEGVAGAKVSHEAKTAVVSLDGDVTDAALKAAVEAQDYKVVSIEP